jgi:hypothetical protein
MRVVSRTPPLLHSADGHAGRRSPKMPEDVAELSAAEGTD